ncbi:unnamed protein product [Rhodiola kirilowii]
MRSQTGESGRRVVHFARHQISLRFAPDVLNYRLNEYNTYLQSLKARREPFKSEIGKVTCREVVLGIYELRCLLCDIFSHRWERLPMHKEIGGVLQNEKVTRLREKLQRDRELLAQDNVKVEKMSKELNVQYGLLESAQKTLEKNRVELLEKFYPNLICAQGLGYMAVTSERLHKQSVVIKQICKLFPQRRVTVDGERKDASNGQYDLICNARLPRGLDPHSVPTDELAASLGYMVQILNLVVHNLAAPAIHNSGFAGHALGYGNETLTGIHAHLLEATGENSWSEKSSSNFGVASMESERKPCLDPIKSTSFDYSAASPHSIETHKDIQRGISLLKKSVACITAYCYNSLCLDVPPEASTFDGFAKLLAMLSSSKEVRSVLVSCSRPYKQVQQLNKSVWNVNSTISSSSLVESAHTLSLMRNYYDNGLLNSAASYIYPSEMSDTVKNENYIEGWDFVEHPTFPPPPSQGEDIEHWTRAMIIDATKK